ncbi:GumC family protein [Flavihumibacter sp. UBA7668]|uniref:GumC family protein n=1 Tax=Flavihumibacter sp. UBA7668 TaxID=1946542 RepID=UPI0025C168F3|nr:tyrosine-protein kinase family protein [Flavihumibacter sp. UBA7668]
MVENNYSSKSINDSSENIGIEAFVRRIVPYWPLFFLGLLVALATTFIYLRYSTKMYKIQSRIIVNDDDLQRSNTDLLNFQYGGGPFPSQAEKEVQILQSRTLLGEVVKRLSLQVRFTFEGKLKAAELYNLAGPISLKLFQPESFDETFFGNVEIIDEKTVEYLGKRYLVDTIVQTPFGLAQWGLDSLPAAFDIIGLEITPLNSAVRNLKNNLQIVPISSQSSIIDLNYLDNKTTRGIDILNTIVDVYSSNYVEFKRRIAQNTLKFIDDRLLLLSQELNSVEKDLEGFKVKEGVIDLSTEGSLFLNQVSEFDQELSKIEVQLKVLEGLRNYVLKRNSDKTPVPATLGLNDPLLQTLLTQLFQAEFEYEKISQLSGKKNPQLEVIDNQIQKLRPSILESISNLERSFQANKIRLKAFVSQRETALKNIPKKERMLLDISRQQSIKNTIYTYLLEKREEAAIQSASIVPNNRVIDQPQDMGVQKPKRMIITIFGLFIWTLIFAFYVFLKEFLNSKFRYRKELEEVLRQPILGELQLVDDGNKNRLVVLENRNDIITEQFREIRTNLAFLPRSGKSQAILFTSSKSGEGKTFVSINLAASLVLTGKKVVLLELDLRKPKLLQYLSMPRTNGVSNYLIGVNEVDEIIQPVKGVDGLFVIGSGPLPPNPAELLLSDKMEKMIDELKDRFDYILLDSPPVGIVTDSRVLGRLADVCFFVVRYNYTDRSIRDLISRLIDKGHFPPINLIFNAIPLHKLISNSYGYGYGYGYGLGYLQNDKSKNTLLRKILRFFRLKKNN